MYNVPISGFPEEIMTTNLLNLTLKGHIFEYFRGVPIFDHFNMAGRR